MKGLVQEGDFVVLFHNHESLIKTRVSKGKISQFKAGKFRHGDIIGKTYGCRIPDLKTRALNVTVLPWTPELHSLSLDHRTQILWAPDISLISAYLGLRSGAILVESGTGSGSATVNFARQVAPNGHVHTFEFHKQRHATATAEFQELNLCRLITCYHRSAYVDGFSEVPAGHQEFGTDRQSGVSKEQADCVFLDLPSPWLALPHADHVLKANSRLVVFSPCFEQVQTMVSSLRNIEYVDIEGFEVICKPIGIWTPEDANRKAERTRNCQEKNLAKQGTRTPSFPSPLKEESRSDECVFAYAPYTVTHLPLRGHTGYIIVATKPIPAV